MYNSIVKILLVIFSFHLSVSAQNKQDSAEPKTTNKTTVRRTPIENLENINEVMYYKGIPFTGTSIENFANKVKKQEIQWVNGLIHGTKTEYFEGGIAIRAQLNFIDGKRHGYFYYRYPNGQISLQGKYIENELDSTVNAFYKDGKPKYIHNYVKGIKNGLSITYFPNGNIEQKVMIVNDLPNGQMVNFYEAGNIRLESFYTRGIRNGYYYRYHLTGIKAEESYFKNGIQDSICRYWDNVFGRLMKEELYENGQLNGPQVTFNEFGDTIQSLHYENGVLNGPYMKYYTGTQSIGKKKNKYKGYLYGLNETGSYVNGLLDGPFKTGLTNKESRAEGTYSKGKMVGEWKYYNAKGKVVLHEKYNDESELIYQKPKLPTPSVESNE